jgi:RimJ/RimL family protein N-acetyltransferase
MFAITERLLLRPSWSEDAAVLHNAIADQGILRNLANAPWPYALDDAREFVALPQSDLLPSASLWTRDGRTPKLVGGCGLAERNGEVELGYWIARPFWGRGFATEAGKALVSAATAIGHKKLVASHFIDNPASGQVLRKLGFQPTGRVEMRASRGRGGRASPALLFEQDLGSVDAADGDAGVSAMPDFPIRSVPECRAA